MLGVGGRALRTGVQKGATAAPKTRRSLIGTLAAVGAGVLGARAADAQVSRWDCGNVVCGSNPGVCNPGCICCTYINGNSRCMPSARCTTPGTVATTTTTPAPTTTTTAAAPLLGLGEFCTSVAQCDQSGGETRCEDQGCVGGSVCCCPLRASCSGPCSCCGAQAGCLDNLCVNLAGG